MASAPARRMFTVGHSNRSIDVFLNLLRAHRIERIIDVRRFPGSRRLPHFAGPELAAALAAADIDYVHLPELGGRRKLDRSAPASAGDAWRNASFRAYAQYAQTPEYEDGLETLMQYTVGLRGAIMCSEAVPWRCHRWLVSDTLVARDVRVAHVIDENAPRAHLPSSFRVLDGQHVRWPGPERSDTLKLGPRIMAG